MTKKERKEKLQEKLTPEYLINSTSIFHDSIGEQPLDKYTVEKIQNNYRLYFNSWIKDELKELLK